MINFSVFYLQKTAIEVINLHTDILWWLSLLGNIFTPRDLSSVIFFTVEENRGEKHVLYKTAESEIMTPTCSSGG